MILKKNNYGMAFILTRVSTGDPAKIIWTGMRKGKELPGNEQGPLSFRTKRMHGGESSSNTYRWTTGNEIIIQIYEGVINIEIMAEI
jgi:hypothetical protein